MEMYHQCGVEAAIRAGRPAARTHRLDRLGARRWPARRSSAACPGAPAPQSAAVSPVRNCLCAQDDLEPVLRALCRAAGAGRAAFRHRSRCLRAGRRTASPPPSSIARAASKTGPGAIRHRRRRRAEPRPPQLGVRDARPGERLRQRQHPVQRRSEAVDGGPAGGALFHRARRRSAAPSSRSTRIDRWGFLVNSLAAYGYKASDFTPERSTEFIRRRPAFPICREDPGRRAVDRLGRMSPSAIARAASSLPAMRRTRCRRPAASA